MGNNKEIVCFCQDVTKEDLIRSIDEGYDNIETLKRYTGVFMGPCQGKTCGMNVLKIFSEKSGQPFEELKVPSIRPPVVPIPLGAIANSNNGKDDE
ncbi:MAG: (2Fe-2S)-binding protein [Desulfobacterales bacterium]|nr:(2Fe-2S)-binding protein [Desulfobacterales bacterium]